MPDNTDLVKAQIQEIESRIVLNGALADKAKAEAEAVRANMNK